MPASLTVNERQTSEVELLKEACKRFAEIVRRVPEAERLGFEVQEKQTDGQTWIAAAAFIDAVHLRRLWERWKVAEQLDAPVRKVAEWTRLSSPRLRKLKHDELVPYLVHRRPGFVRVEQLLESFLVDPGLGPVVQTFRMQLAISSIELYVRHCLLNNEQGLNFSPTTPEHWQWMKRYRVWEANRKIFLFPENWLEAELRGDKSGLFQELEGAEAQGDVSDELAEEAFLSGLKNLEQIARLEVVSMFCENDPADVASNTLHLIGRTYGLPHQYFYRRYADGLWSAWEPLGTEIECDHIAAVIWRGRLHLFEVTCLEETRVTLGQLPG